MKRFHRRGAALSAFRNTIVPKHWENDKWARKRSGSSGFF
jgi:hypothetical protein